MRPSKLLSVFLALLIGAQVASPQSSSIHDEIGRTYSFQPHVLNKQEIAQKSDVLDKFWTSAKAQPTLYIPALRQELADPKNPAFFFYDGSMLLLSLSDTAADQKVALAAMARCDLRDVQTRDYFLKVHRLATLNQDTTAAAFHVLENPNFKVIIPQHALTLGQDYVLIYLLLPTDPAYWLEPAINRLRTEAEPTAQKSLLLLLWYAQTDAADRAITAFAGDQHEPSASRTYAQELLHRKDNVPLTSRAKALATSEDSTRKKRRERMKAVSDEALYDLDDYTAVLVAKRR